MSLAIVLQALYILAMPAVVLVAVDRIKPLSFLGPVLLCYGVGMILANIPGVPVNGDVSRAFTDASVPLAIPMLLFPTQLMLWLRHSKSAVLSFAIAVVSATTASVVAFHVMGDQLEYANQIAGMLLGTYTGGTPNLLSIALALESPKELTILLSAADTLVCGIWLFIVMLIGKPLFALIYRPFDGERDVITDAELVYTRKEKIIGGLEGLGLSILFLLVSVGISFVLTGKPADTIIVIFGITAGGILASFIPKVRELPGVQELGNFLILIFCVAIGTLTDLVELIEKGGAILTFTTIVVVITLLMHFSIARLFNLDGDTVLITSTAAVFGPPFVVLVSELLDNKGVLLSGMTTGLVGYAIGNYLGIAIALWLGG